MKINLKSFSLDANYIVIKIKEHKEIKPLLIDLIDEMPNSTIEKEGEYIEKSDWHLPKDYERKYLNCFYKIIKPYLNEFTNFLKSSGWTIHNGWFQQYKNKNFHNWHNHGASMYSCIYYLELPEKNMQTEYLNVSNMKIKKFNIKEGDLLIFPSYVTHRSSIILSNNKKTIISFNISITK